MVCDPTYRQAMALAWTALDGMDAKELAHCCGAELRDAEMVLATLGEETSVDLKDRMVLTPTELGGGWGLITLHHLRGCREWKRDEEWVSFEQIAGARPFAAAFRQRAVVPLAHRFGGAPRELQKRGRPLGGRPLSMGDAAALFLPFPKVRVAVIIWQGDGDIPPGANLLFDRGGAATLPAEDLAELGIVLSQMLVSTDR